MNFISGAELLAVCADRGLTISGAMRAREAEFLGQDPAGTDQELRRRLSVMEKAATTAMKNPARSLGGFLGGEAQKLQKRVMAGQSACGSRVGRAAAYACSVLEVNARMGVIVAAPTAGSSGVLPGVLFSLRDELGLAEEKLVDGLWNAGAVGYLFSRNASVSGAEAGCQAEVGVASAMAASAAAQLLGGDPEACLQAAALAITNILGLVCDPAGGLVETPCQQRNAMGAANGLLAAEMALAGIRNAAPFDETAEMLLRVGRALPETLRETALGGLAACPSVCERCGGGCGM